MAAEAGSERACRAGDGRDRAASARRLRMTLAEAGAAVAVNYRERADDAEAVVAGIKAGGGRAIAVAADVSQAAAVAEMVEQVARDARPDRHSRQQCRHRDRARRR